MTDKESIYSQGFAYPFFKAFFTPSLRPSLLRCLYSIFYNFFYAQFKGALRPGRIPVISVDHPLDNKIPFTPAWVSIYLDFVFYWTRIVSLFLKRYGKEGFSRVGEFITSIGELYAYAAQVYKKSFSTTKRPFYIARPRFLLIHLMDPHLMCIPSLHVMIVIHGYTQFIQIAKEFNDDNNLKDQIKLMRQGALAITQAVLFVKQHSVNCIPAALYAMTRFSPNLFTEEEAVKFTEELYSKHYDVPPSCRKLPSFHPASSPKTDISLDDAAEIKSYIISMYKKFLKEGQEAPAWEEPLLNFLKNYNGNVYE